MCTVVLYTSDYSCMSKFLRRTISQIDNFKRFMETDPFEAHNFNIPIYSMKNFTSLIICGSAKTVCLKDLDVYSI